MGTGKRAGDGTGHLNQPRLFCSTVNSNNLECNSRCAGKAVTGRTLWSTALILFVAFSFARYPAKCSQWNVNESLLRVMGSKTLQPDWLLCRLLRVGVQSW